MKKALLIISILFVALTAKAQWGIGGGFNAEFFESYNSLRLAPELCYCIPDTPFSLGFAAIFGFGQDKTEGTPFTLEEITFSPYFRYEFHYIGDFAFFVDLCGDVNLYGPEGFDVGFAPGISYCFNDHWSAEFSYGWLGYEQFDEKGFSASMDASTTKLRIYYSF